MKNILRISFVWLLLIVVSCSDFDEINTNPNDPTEVPSGLLLADGLRITMNTLYSTFVGGDMGLCWAQQWSKNQYNEEERYLVRESVMESTWDNFFASVIQDVDRMYQLAVAEGNENNQGVALIVKSYGFLTLTDLYGAIPFSEALQSGEDNFTPVFDSQKDVYLGVLGWLDEARALLATDNGEINPNTDILYGGDADSWRRFGNSLKFRALMRISSASDPGVDIAGGLNALLSTDMFESNADEANMAYLPAEPNANPMFESIVAGNRIEYVINEKLVDILAYYGPGDYDPRITAYAELNEDMVYRGKPSGLDPVPLADYNINNVSAVGEHFLEAELPGTFMSYAELQFLMAEAAQRGLIGGTAADYYQAGIQASFESVGLGSDYAAYSVGNNVPLSGNSAEAMQQIAEQKWIALYGQGIEAWLETRRTGYPELTPAIQGVLGGQLPWRFTYPLVELSLNASGVASGVALQGDNLLTTKLWQNL